MLTSALPAPPLVCVLAYDGLCTFEYGIATEIFGSGRPDAAPYRFSTIGVDAGPMRAMGGLSIADAEPLSMLDNADTIIIPGWRGPDAPIPEDLHVALGRACRRGARIVSICSGAFVLAQAGLLAGRKATTHWRYMEKLSAYVEDWQLEPNSLYVEDRNIWTSAGSAAGVDLCLHLVRMDYGVNAANAVARGLVLPAHREGGQTQYIPKPVGPEGGSLGPLLETVLSRLCEDWPVAKMAATAGTSQRTLLRRFKNASGMSPKQWLLQQRLFAAREQLEATTASIDEVAWACGFGASETLRHHFKARFGLSPTAYRNTFLSGVSTDL